MPGRNIFFAFSLVFGICIVAGCSKESPVVEKKFTNISLSAFTVDPYRFRVSLTNEVVTDSLITPEGKVGKVIFFTDYRQRIKVYNTSDESLLIDTPYTLKVGKTNSFTIYQTQTGAQPFYLAPSPGEPAAAAGNTKLSLICSGELLSDSVRIIVEVQPTGTKPNDTVALKKDNFSRYFEVPANMNIKVYLQKIPGNQSLAEKLVKSTELNEDFTIYRLLYNGTSTLSYQKLY